MFYILTPLIILIILLYFLLNIKKNDIKIDLNNKQLKVEKQIIIIESNKSCIQYKNFKQKVLLDYKGNIPVKEMTLSQLELLNINLSIYNPQMILFVNNAKDVCVYDSYITPKEFYLAVGLLKFGKSKAYKVAFDEDTDGRFCQRYEKFKNTPEGYFVDPLSGIPLFDTKDRYNSGTGWLSFTKAMEDAVIEKIDPKYGTQMIEIRAKLSGIHLGHVFQDGINGNLRYCINATVLDFLPK